MRKVAGVEKGGLAERHGIRAGDHLVAINGEPVLDEIDFQALVANRKLVLEVQRPNGNNEVINLINQAYLPLGITFDDALISKPRLCANDCIFCFVDQMPPGLRPTLYVKDDDWRLSLMMGNYVTLTNVGEKEFERIIRRHASPLYVSVHATDVEVRKTLMGNEHAGDILARLRRLAEAGISFHTQVVLCPGVNDGPVLEQTIGDLLTLTPHVLSIAMVPVGLTRYRQALPEVRVYTKAEAVGVISLADQLASRALSMCGSHLIYVADEFYCLAGVDIPDAAYYEEFPQVENGVGMIRQFEDELRQAYAQADQTQPGECHATIACGTSIAPHMERWMHTYAPKGVQVVPVFNTFFGETVTVSGLLTGQDLLSQLKDKVRKGPLLLPSSMLNSDQTMFLDNMTPDQLGQALGCSVQVVEVNGASLMAAISALKE